MNKRLIFPLAATAGIGVITFPPGQFAVAIRLEGEDQAKFPIGTQGRAAIYTNPASWFVILRKIGIRTHPWFDWLYPFSG